MVTNPINFYSKPVLEINKTKQKMHTVEFETKAIDWPEWLHSHSSSQVTGKLGRSRVPNILLGPYVWTFFDQKLLQQQQQHCAEAAHRHTDLQSVIQAQYSRREEFCCWLGQNSRFLAWMASNMVLYTTLWFSL